MARGQSIQRVDQPVNAVWRMLADHHAIATWAPGMAVHMERDGEPDPAGTGAIRVINGPGLRIREEITAFDPPRRMAYRALSGVPLPGWAGEVGSPLSDCQAGPQSYGDPDSRAVSHRHRS